MSDSGTGSAGVGAEQSGRQAGTGAGIDLGGVVHVSRERYLPYVREMRSAGFEACMDVSAVDYLTHPGRALPDGISPGRFELVVQLLSLSQARRMRLRIQVPEADPVVDSLFDVYPGTEAMEREVFDLMGIVFRGHPDLTRILMPEEWEGHPLRKDYSTGRVPVQFRETPVER